jgi:hypothetical protein
MNNFIFLKERFVATTGKNEHEQQLGLKHGA